MGRPFEDFIAARVALMKLFRVFVAALTGSGVTNWVRNVWSRSLCPGLLPRDARWNFNSKNFHKFHDFFL